MSFHASRAILWPVGDRHPDAGLRGRGRMERGVGAGVAAALGVGRAVPRKSLAERAASLFCWCHDGPAFPCIVLAALFALGVLARWIWSVL